MRKMMVLCLEGIALSVALLAGLFFFAHWRISHGGIDLGFMKSQLTGTLESRLADGSSVGLGRLLLKRDEQAGQEQGPIRLYVYDFEVTGPEQQPLVQLPEVSFQLQTSDLIRGQLSPRFVSISNADLSITRLEDGSFDFGLTTSATGAGSNVFDTILKERGNKPAAERLFEGAEFINTSFLFTDQATGKVWQTTEAMAEVWKTDTGYDSELTATFLLDRQQSNLNVSIELNDRTREVLIDIQTTDAPVSELLSLLVGPVEATRFQTDLTGSVELAIGYDGKLVGGRINVAANGGAVNFAGNDVEFDRFVLQSDYRDSDRRFDIDLFDYEISGNAGKLNGVVSLGAWTPGTPLAPSKVEYDLTGRDVTVNLPDKLQEPLTFPAAQFAGAYLIDEQELRFEQLGIDFFGKRLEGQLDILLPEQPGQSPGVRSTASFAGELTHEEVLKGWPLVLADGARRWVAENVIEGTFSEIDFTMDMPRGAIQPATSIGEESMSLSFNFKDASSYFVPGVTPITGLSGSASLGGNSMVLTAGRGRVGDVRLLGGKIDMPNFYPKGSRGIFSVKIAGAVDDILSIIDEEPMGFVSRGGFDPSDFSGTGQFDFRITRPLLSYVPIDDYEFFGSGQFSNLTLDDVLASYDLADGNGRLEVSWDGLDVYADAAIAGTPVKFEYLREFTDTEDTIMRATGVVNAKSADELGLPLRQFIRGDVTFDVEVSESNQSYEFINLSTDLSQAEVRLEVIDWAKRLGAPGSASISVTPPAAGDENGLWNISDFRIESQDLQVAGNILLNTDGSFIRAEMDRVEIPQRADLSISVAKEDEALVADLTGAYANADFLIDDLFRQGAGGDDDGSGLPGAITVNVNLDELDLRDGVGFSGFSAQLRHNGTQVSDVFMSGNFEDGGYLTATLAATDDYDIGRQLQVQTDNMGAVARGIFGISSIQAGRADYTATFLNSGVIAGTFSADRFVISNAPVITRLLAAGSLDGLADLLSGEGIEFTNVTADVQLDEGVMSIVDARVTGPSLGVSIGGEVDFVLDIFDINGAMAPAYQVNSVLGQVPGLGRLLVSREGEGIVAFGYGLNGPITEPTITVNTLSLLTPGIFRRIFEPVRADKMSTSELLDQAIAAAELAQQLDYTGSPEQLREMQRSLGILTDEGSPDDEPPVQE